MPSKDITPISIRQDRFKSLNANGGKGAGRGASGTSRNVTKGPSAYVQGFTKKGV